MGICYIEDASNVLKVIFIICLVMVIIITIDQNIFACVVLLSKNSHQDYFGIKDCRKFLVFRQPELFFYFSVDVGV